MEKLLKGLIFSMALVMLLAVGTAMFSFAAMSISSGTAVAGVNDEYNDEDDENDENDEDDEKEDEYDKDEYAGKDEYEKDGYDSDEYSSKATVQTKTRNQNSSSLQTTRTGSEDEYSDSSKSDEYDAYDGYDGYDEYSDSPEVVQNADGTTTFRYTRVSGDETKILERTVSADGRRIMERKLEAENGKEELKVKTYDVFGKLLSSYQLKLQNGSVVSIKTSDVEQGKSKLRFNVSSQSLVVKTGDDGNENHLRIRSTGENFVISRSGTAAMTSFPLAVDEATGKITITTPMGRADMNAMPDTIVQQAKSDGEFSRVGSTAIVDQNGPKYVVSGVKAEKFLGIFTVEIPAYLTYDVQSGSLVRSSTPFFSKMIDLFSF